MRLWLEVIGFLISSSSTVSSPKFVDSVLTLSSGHASSNGRERAVADDARSWQEIELV